MRQSLGERTEEQSETEEYSVLCPKVAASLRAAPRTSAGVFAGEVVVHEATSRWVRSDVTQSLRGADRRWHSRASAQGQSDSVTGVEAEAGGLVQVTCSLRPEDTVETVRGKVRADNWCKTEAERLRSAGRQVEVILDGSGVSVWANPVPARDKEHHPQVPR